MQGCSRASAYTVATTQPRSLPTRREWTFATVHVLSWPLYHECPDSSVDDGHVLKSANSPPGSISTGGGLLPVQERRPAANKTMSSRKCPANHQRSVRCACRSRHRTTSARSTIKEQNPDALGGVLRGSAALVQGHGHPCSTSPRIHFTRLGNCEADFLGQTDR